MLFDPSQFLIEATDKINLFNEFFNDEIALQFTGKNVLFISDIRNIEMSDHFDDKKLVEEIVRQDMENQKRWLNIIKPRKAMLKFRLPWENGETTYLDGQLYLPVWGTQTTTETRLITECCNEIKYDNRLYESQMFYFNTVTRVTCYPHLPDFDTVIGEGLDHCFDCTSEIRILNNYITKKGEMTDNNRIATMSKKISTALGHRRLCDKQPDKPSTEE